MGIGGVGVWQLLIVFGIAVVIFGTSRLNSIGGDLGGAIKGFRKAMENDDRSGPSSGPGSVEATPIARGSKLDRGPAERIEVERQV